MSISRRVDGVWCLKEQKSSFKVFISPYQKLIERKILTDLRIGLFLERKPLIYGLYNSKFDSSDFTDSPCYFVLFDDLLLDPLIDSLFESHDMFRYFDTSKMLFGSLNESD